MSPEARDQFFGPPKSKFLSERVRSLKRLLVTRSPIMPTGLLLFALEYASTGKPEGGVLGAICSSFSELSDSDLVGDLKQQYDFRNEYIAHEKREPLRSPEAAEEALQLWVSVLSRLRRLEAASAVGT